MAALLWLGLVTSTYALNLNYTASYWSTLNSDGAVVLCNTTLDSANASGVVIQTPSANVSQYGYGFAISQNNRASSPGFGLQASLLFSPLSRNYLDDNALGYDACLLVFNIPNLLFNTILRGQNDNGSCIQTFDTECVEALQDIANDAASQSGTPAQVASSLSNVCDNISGQLGGNIPDACKVFLGSDGYSLLGAYASLTQSSTGSGSYLTQSCRVTSGGNTFYNLGTEVGGYSTASYDLGANAVWPVMTVFMPSANSGPNGVLKQPYSQMTCLKIDHYTNGSRIAPSLGTPTPLSTGTSSSSATASSVAASSETAAAVSTATPSTSLGAGAIAAIVIAIFVVALIAVGAFITLRKRRRRRQNQMMAGGIDEDKRHLEISGAPVSELSSASVKPELPTAYTWELQGNQQFGPGSHRHELDDEKAGQVRGHVYELASPNHSDHR